MGETTIWPMKSLAMLLGLQGLLATTKAQTLSTNPFGEDSTSNPYSEAGSPFGVSSINNHFSEAGSPFGLQSANNPFAQGPSIDTENPLDKSLGLDDKSLGLETKSDPLQSYAERTQELSKETEKMLQTRLKESELETEKLSNALEEAISNLNKK